MSEKPYPNRSEPDQGSEESIDPEDETQEYTPAGVTPQIDPSPEAMHSSQPYVWQAGELPSQTAGIQPETTSLKETASPAKPQQDKLESWFVSNEVEEMRSRWTDIQVQFVDSPCSAVEQGDALVAEIVERVKQTITDQQDALNKLWVSKDDISTEELRIALLNYRSLLNHLLKL